MKNKIIISGIALFILLLSAISCSPVLGKVPVTPAPGNSQVPDVVIPNWDMVENFIKTSSTYQYDGIEGTVKLVNATADAADRNWEYTVEYQTRHAGHGDRTGHMMAQVITTHIAVVTVTNGEMTSAVCDNSWDMLKDAPVSVPWPDIQASLGQQFTLPVGQEAVIPSEDLIVKFVEVTSDSRSPKGAQTVWAGEAVCRLQVTYQGATSEITLMEQGGTDGFTQVSLLQYKLNFQLEPYPEVGYQPDFSEYTLLITITG